MQFSPVLIAASVSLFTTASLRAQTAPVPPYGQPAILTKQQAQAQSKMQMTQAHVQSIRLLEQGFDRLSNLITANPYHLSQEEVVGGFGEAFNAQVRQEGALMLGTIIKANKIMGRTDPWLAQEWVQAWMAVYRIDPVTGELMSAP